MSAGAFYYRIDDLINQVTDPADSMLVYRNVDSVETQGIELEADKTWASGVRTRASFAYQAAHDKATGAWLTNSPRNLVKLNVSLPLAANRARAGLELQYTSPRRTDSAGIGGFTVANLTLSSTALAKNLDVSLGLYNLAGKRYADPAASLDSPAQDRVAQDGRTVRLKLTYRF